MADLNKRRWRVVATLGDPLKARRMSAALTRAYAVAMFTVGQYAVPGNGGGGGGATSAIPAGKRPSEATRPEHARFRGSDAIKYDKRGN